MKVGDVVRPKESAWGFLLDPSDRGKVCHVSAVRPAKNGGWEVFVTVVGETPRAGHPYRRMINCAWFHESWFEVDEFLTKIYEERVAKV